MATAIIFIILVIICVFGIRSTVKRTRNGCCGGGGDDVKKVKVEDKNISHYPYSYSLEVDGMTCGNCKKRVENALNSQKGVFASVNLEKKLATIRMKDELPEDELKELVRKAGYFPGDLKKIS